MEKELPETIRKVFLKEHLKILLIDDNLLIKDSILAIFKKSYPSARFTLPGSFVDAQLCCEKEAYDIVLLDGSLGKWDGNGVKNRKGQDLIPLIRKSNQNAMIIFISTRSVVGEALYKEKQVDFYINKDVLDKYFS